MATQVVASIGAGLLLLWVFWGLPESGHTLEFDLRVMAKAYLIVAIYTLALTKFNLKLIVRGYFLIAVHTVKAVKSFALWKKK